MLYGILTKLEKNQNFMGGVIIISTVVPTGV